MKKIKNKQYINEICKHGECTITNEDGDEMYAEAEWIRNGVMIVTDEDGNEYDMEAQ